MCAYVSCVCKCVVVAPVLRTLSPNNGVVDGGRSIIIKGTYEGRITPVAVYFAQFQSPLVYESVAQTFSAIFTEVS